MCPNRRRIVKLQLNPHFLAQQELLLKFGYFPLMASQEQTGLLLEAAVYLEARGQVLQFANRIETQLVAPGRTDMADFFDQLPQRNIDFVLEQSGARAGAARSNVPLIDQQSLDSRFRQMNGHQRPGDPAADNDRVTRNIAL